MGLIGLIPIVGGLQQTGWLLASLDNLRSGRNEVPPAGFRYATRGVWLFLAGLVYGFIFVLLFYGSFFLLIAAMGGFSQTSGQTESGSSSHALSLLFFPLSFVYFGVIGLVGLAVWIFVPLVIEFADRRKFAGAFDVPGFFRALAANPRESLAAGGLSLVAYLISGIGTYLCYVGIIFTAPYALTVLAGVLRWYEVKAKPGTLPA
jgi:hypothetical protein